MIKSTCEPLFMRLCLHVNRPGGLSHARSIKAPVTDQFIGGWIKPSQLQTNYTALSFITYSLLTGDA